MLRMLAPLLEGVLMAALADDDFRRWVEAEFSAAHVEQLEQLRARLDVMCKARGW